MAVRLRRVLRNLVLAFRWIDPPLTMVMLLQDGPVGYLEHNT